MKKILLSFAALIFTQNFAWAESRLYNWYQIKNNVPGDSFSAGYENFNEGKRDLYVCRVSYNNEVHPGKVAGNTCYIPYWGKELTFSKFQVLNKDFKWQDIDNSIPGNSLTAGYEADKNNREKPLNHDLYICRGEYKRNVIPGKVSGNICYIPFSGQEIPLFEYEVLTSDDPEKLKWVKGDNIPQGAVNGGQEKISQGNETFSQKNYICRAYYQEEVFPGKTSGGKCKFGYWGSELESSDYEILTGEK